MSLLCFLDAAFLLVLLVCAIDVVRQTSPLRHPAHAIGFGAMSIGAAGWILQDLSGVVPSWYAIVFHGGLATYAALGAYALYAHKRGKQNESTNPIRAAVSVANTATNQTIH